MPPRAGRVPRVSRPRRGYRFIGRQQLLPFAAVYARYRDPRSSKASAIAADFTTDINNWSTIFRHISRKSHSRNEKKKIQKN